MHIRFRDTDIEHHNQFVHEIHLNSIHPISKANTKQSRHFRLLHKTHSLYNILWTIRYIEKKCSAAFFRLLAGTTSHSIQSRWKKNKFQWFALQPKLVAFRISYANLWKIRFSIYGHDLFNANFFDRTHIHCIYSLRSYGINKLTVCDFEILFICHSSQNRTELNHFSILENCGSTVKKCMYEWKKEYHAYELISSNGLLKMEN